MNNPILFSTLFLTLLFLVGLIFFIRASVKQRIEKFEFTISQGEDMILSKLEQYFQARAYQILAVDAANNHITFQGLVRPSWFLTIFLSFLAACGLVCLSLVLSFLLPFGGSWWLILTLLAPLAGMFYWQKAQRLEQVLLSAKFVSNSDQEPSTLITITAHRDELIQLKQSDLVKSY